MSKAEFVAEVQEILRVKSRRRMSEYTGIDPARFDFCARMSAELYWALRQVRGAVVSAPQERERTEHLLSHSAGAALHLVHMWMVAEKNFEHACRSFEREYNEVIAHVKNEQPLTLVGRLSPLTRVFIETIHLLRLRTYGVSEGSNRNLSLAYCLHNIAVYNDAFNDDGVREMEELKGVLFASALASGIVMAIPAVYFELFTKVPVVGYEFSALALDRNSSGQTKTSSRIVTNPYKHANVERVVIGDDTLGSQTTLRVLSQALKEKYPLPEKGASHPPPSLAI